MVEARTILFSPPKRKTSNFELKQPSLLLTSNGFAGCLAPLPPAIPASGDAVFILFPAIAGSTLVTAMFVWTSAVALCVQEAWEPTKKGGRRRHDMEA